MPFNFSIEGPETRKARELDTRLREMSVEKLRRDIDDQYALQKGMESAKAAQAAAFDTTRSLPEQAYALRQYGEKVGYQKIPGTEMQVPTGTSPEMVEGLLGNAVNNVQRLRMSADMEQDPTRKRILTGIADSAETGLKSKAKELSAADLSFESNIKAGLRYADEFENTINKYGTFEVMSPEGSAKLGQLPYQMAIAYSKIVDPSSVAREGEVAAAQKYIIPIGALTRNETAIAAVRGFRNDIQQRASAYSAISGRSINYKPEKDQSYQSQTYQPQSYPTQQSAQPQTFNQPPSGGTTGQANFIYSNGKLIPK